MKFELRPVDHHDDLPELAAMLDQVMTDGMSVSRLRGWLTNVRPINRARIATIDSGVIVGWSILDRTENAPIDRAFASLIVHPAHRRHGIGEVLLSDIASFCRTVGITNLKSQVKDNQPGWLAWAESKGFAIERHSFRSSVKLAEFDFKPFENSITQLVNEGITFTTLANIGDSEANGRRYYEADSKAAIDVPGEDSIETWEEFRHENFNDEGYLPQGAHVAMHEQQIVAVAHAWLDKDHNRMVNAMTGVIPEYRGRGIATALKVKTIEYAKDLGVSEILTQNDSENAQILAVNNKLGYKRWPGAYQLKASLS